MLRIPSERGQSTVEFALCLPLVAVLVALVLQVGVVAVDMGRLWHAAREAARVAAVTGDREAIRRAAETAGVDLQRLSVDPVGPDRAQGAPVTVDVRHDPAASIPLVGRLLDGVSLTASATMRIETP